MTCFAGMSFSPMSHIMGINPDLRCFYTELIRLTHVLFFSEGIVLFQLVKHPPGGLCPEEPVAGIDLTVDMALSSALPISHPVPIRYLCCLLIPVKLQPVGLVCLEEPVARPHGPWLTISWQDWGIELASAPDSLDLTICVCVAFQLIV